MRASALRMQVNAPPTQIPAAALGDRYSASSSFSALQACTPE